MRQTSLATYHEIKASGLLSKLRFKVYDILFHRGPLTTNEVVEITGGTQYSISPRFAELRHMDAIYEAGERTCTVTGRNVIEWDVTSSLPKKLEKTKLSKAERKKLLLEKIIAVGKEIDPKWKQPLRDIFFLANSL